MDKEEMAGAHFDDVSTVSQAIERGVHFFARDAAGADFADELFKSRAGVGELGDVLEDGGPVTWTIIGRRDESRRGTHECVRYDVSMRGAVMLVVTAGMLLAQHRGTRNPGVPPPSAAPEFKDLVVKFVGALKNITKKEITIETDETHEIMTFRRAKDTKFTEDGAEVKATKLDLESHVTVEAKQDPDSKLRAVAVRTGHEKAGNP